MRSRTLREGTTGLLILGGIGLFIALGLWLRGVSPGGRGFQIIVSFDDAQGIQPGTVVRYRGVEVGQVVQVSPDRDSVAVQIAIRDSRLQIPADATIESNQSGLIGETFIDIKPQGALPAGDIALPNQQGCDKQVILCNGSRTTGEVGVSIDKLLRVSTELIELVGAPELLDGIKDTTKSAARAADGIAELSKEVTTLAKILQEEVRSVSGSVKLTASSISNAADELGLTAAQVNALIVENRGSVVATLDNISASSQQLRILLGELTPIAGQLSESKILDNLATLSRNAAQTSENLRNITDSLNTPENILLLQQTLDSARTTFQNIQKITSDLDELTGDPNFRRNLRDLVRGLSGLVSSTQQLERQARMAQLLETLAQSQALATPPEQAQPSPSQAGSSQTDSATFQLPSILPRQSARPSQPNQH